MAITALSTLLVILTVIFIARQNEIGMLSSIAPPKGEDGICPLQGLTDEECEEFRQMFKIVWENPDDLDMDSEEYQLAEARYDELLEIGEARQKNEIQSGIIVNQKKVD